MLSKKYQPYLLLLLFAIPLYFLNITNVHSWGDDFAQYIKEALNIAHGKPFYQSNYIYNSYNTNYAPPQYPPGFPLLLAPVVKVWGVSFIAMCYFSSFIVTCLLFALFAYFRKYTGTVAAICLSVLICYSQVVIDLKRNVLADLPCLLFFTLYFLYRNARQYSWQRIAALVFFAAMAIQNRSQAIFLLAAEGVWLFLSVIKASVKEKKLTVNRQVITPALFVVPGVILLDLFIDKVLFYSPLPTNAFYNSFLHEAAHWDLKKIAEDYTGYLLKTISAYFYFDAHNGFRRAVVLFMTNMGLTFTITGFIINVYRRLSVEDVFFGIMCVVIIFFPGRDVRYFLPVIPILFYYCYTTFKAILTAVTTANGRWMAVAITVLYIGTGYEYLKTAATETVPGCIPEHKDLVAIDYLKKHVSDKDIIVFTKPRMLTLFTDKRSMNVSWQLTQEMNKRVFDSLQVKYILVVDGLDDAYFKTYLRAVQQPVDSARISEGYTLYSLR